MSDKDKKISVLQKDAPKGGGLKNRNAGRKGKERNSNKKLGTFKEKKRIGGANGEVKESMA